jgi:hypothetical protein
MGGGGLGASVAFPRRSWYNINRKIIFHKKIEHFSDPKKFLALEKLYNLLKGTIFIIAI